MKSHFPPLNTCKSTARRCPSRRRPGRGKYFETTADDDERADYYSEIATVDVYFHQQQLRGGRAGGIQDYYYEAVLMRFEDEPARPRLSFARVGSIR